jgi:hypothetical protein
MFVRMVDFLAGCPGYDTSGDYMRFEVFIAVKI